MEISRSPSVFVSSTCYDLAQVRQNLCRFLETLGMNPVLSEFSSFPINPELDAIDNCLTAVKQNADILILVVGGRYGTQVGTGKSITNMEYLEAKAKGIPCYIFVQKTILNTLPIWRNNPQADFSSVVDSPQLFSFVDSLRNPKNGWVFPFESAEEIVETLRKQFAYLFTNSLLIRKKIINSGISENFQDLSPAAMLILVQKPFAWEHRLASQVLADELNRLSSVKMDLEYGVVFRPIVILDDEKALYWIRAKVQEMLLISRALATMVNVALKDGFGPPGQPGNPKKIIYACKRLAGTYRSILEWTADFKHVIADERCVKLVEAASKLSSNVISEIEEFSAQLQSQLSEAVRQHEMNPAERIEVRLGLVLTCPDLTEYESELKKTLRSFGVS